eukprot:SAG25_NODE_3_length_30426_cov_8.268210_6_plen_125_part_00
MVSRASLIADMKKRKVKGALSKMNKAQLHEMHAKAMESATDENTTLDVTAGAAATILPQGGGGISLAVGHTRIGRGTAVETGSSRVMRASARCIMLRGLLRGCNTCAGNQRRWFSDTTAPARPP